MADRVVIRGGVRGAGPIARNLRGARLALHRDLTQTMHELGDDLADDLREGVPRGNTDQLHDSIQVNFVNRAARPGFTITVGARDLDSGFDYTRVSRFGHRKKRIVAKKGRALLVKEHLKVGSQVPEGTLIRSVPGVKKSHDWVEVGLLASDHKFEAATERLGRRVERRLFR